MLAANTTSWDRQVALLQPRKHCRLVVSRYHPKHPSSTIECGVGQGHPSSALIDSCHRYVLIGDVEDRISWHQRCRVPVGTEPKVHEIEAWRCAGNLAKDLLVVLGGSDQIGRLNRHGVDLLRPKR